MPVKVLNVAEKPSVAKEVSRILSNGGARSRRGRSQYNPIWEFCYTINGTQCDMVFTSVAGHLMELEFLQQYKRWRGCSPLDLYTAPVVKDVPQDKAPLKDNLQQLARQCQWLVLWLDCDREGENISFEVMQVCQAVNHSLRILRARFSALIPRELQRALQQLVAPNAADAAAVDARQEIDLRIGASFTRFQTLLLQEKFDWAGGGVDNEKPILSYGPCQFPTLGLIVQRAWEIQSHISEPFWYIAASYRPPPDANQPPQQARLGCDFTWARGRLFDQDVATMLYEMCTEEPIVAIVTQVRGRETLKRAPVPLATLEMCKAASSTLRMSGERIMKLAEELYQGGWISYPRTETDVYDPGMNLRGIVADQTNDARWGAHAAAILSGAMWKSPRPGGHDDKAHPPIHPTRYSPGEQDWSHDKKQLYEFVVRHFLASCSKDAVGFETNVTIDIGRETFRTTGLMVTERNWLDVFRWATWGGNANLPNFVEGQQFAPTEVALRQGSTAPPPRLAERDLIAAMERHGIGTDATVAEHIQKQIDRGYAEKDHQLTFWPTPLGESLISAYRRMGLDNLWKPDLRGRIEQGISRIAAGLVTKDQILQQAINAFRVDFQAAMQRTQTMVAEVARFFQLRNGAQGPFGGPPGNGPGGGGGGGWGPGPGGGGGGDGPRSNGAGGAGSCNGPAAGGNGLGGPGVSGGNNLSSDSNSNRSALNLADHVNNGNSSRQAQLQGQAGLSGDSASQQPLGACVKCGSLLMLEPRSGITGARVVCSAAPLCDFALQLPRSVSAAAIAAGGRCQRCRHGEVLKVKLAFMMKLLPPGIFAEPEYTGCILCDPLIQQLIQLSGTRQRPTAAGASGGPTSDSQFAAGNTSSRGFGLQNGSNRHQNSQSGQQANQLQPQQQSQQHQQGHNLLVAVPPPLQRPAAGGATLDWGTSAAAKQRKQGDTKHGGGSGSRSKGGRSVGSSNGGAARKGRGSRASRADDHATAAAAAAGHPGDGARLGAENVPLCPVHNEPLRAMTSNSAANPGRAFYKCSHPPEDGGDSCLKFAWADEYNQAGPAGGGTGNSRQRGNSSSSRGGGRAATRSKRGRGRGGSNAGGGGFVSVTGAPIQVCYRCNQPGHWATQCPNM